MSSVLSHPPLCELAPEEQPEEIFRKASTGATCVMDYRLSPFCWTRLQAASRCGPVLSLEMSAETREYAWAKVEAKGDFTRVTLFPDGEAYDAPQPEMLRRLQATLDQYRPTTVAIVGWSFNWSLAALMWCLQNQVPSILLSDSTGYSAPRPWWKEQIKRRLVKLYSVALVAGKPQREYVTSLGMPGERIFRAWDVVDNDYYATRSDEARRHADPLRAKFQLPENYFVSVSRFIDLKNVLRLIEAYAAYRSAAGASAWKLVLIGDGPLKPQVLELQRRFNLGDDLLLPGWKQYPELPIYYGLAGAFVLASTIEPWGLVVNEAMASGLPVLVSDRCGCAVDLVANGRNGCTFDPLDVPQLTRHMTQMADTNTNRRDMGAASREIISQWSPEVWAENLQLASETALALPRPQASAADQLLLRLLTRL